MIPSHIYSRERKLLIVEGPDGSGKTNIAEGLALKYQLPYFKQAQQKKNWTDGGDSYLNELRFGERRQIDLIRRLGIDAVFDRGFPSEWVYSQVFGRKTDMDYLNEVDKAYAQMGAYVIICLRHDYGKVREDDLFDVKKNIEALHDAYLRFVHWSRCDTRVIYVDAFGNDLQRELMVLAQDIEFDDNVLSHTNIVYDKVIEKKDNPEQFVHQMYEKAFYYKRSK